MDYTGCEFVELCPVCGFIGTPILTMKGIRYNVLVLFKKKKSLTIIYFMGGCH